ncbi:MAG: hypothetical protein ACI4TI_02380 [Christensenellales bacterium]
MKIIGKILLFLLCVALGVGIAHAITYKDKLVESWNNTFNKTETSTEENSTNAKIAISSNGQIKII